MLTLISIFHFFTPTFYIRNIAESDRVKLSRYLNTTQVHKQMDHHPVLKLSSRRGSMFALPSAPMCSKYNLDLVP